MQQVITTKQAKQITHGRTPLVPVEYEDALKALASCLTIDESKYWSDKADALAAWAKIYHSDKALRQAKQLKLHAYRRMGELANELRPKRIIPIKGQAGLKGSLPGPLSLLVENGLTCEGAQAARRIARMPKDRFDSFVNRPKPPSPSSLGQFVKASSPEWTIFKIGFGSFAGSCQRIDVRKMERSMTETERAWAKSKIRIVVEYLDEFEQLIDAQACERK